MRNYLPFSGELAQYGYGPEHTFFEGEVSPPVEVPVAPTTSPYTPSENPFIAAYQQGRSEGDGGRGSAERGEQSTGSGSESWSGAKNALANMAGFALGPFTALGGLGVNAMRGSNSPSMGLLGALGINPFGTAHNPAFDDISFQNATRNTMSSSLGQTSGSPSQDFFGAINDLGTVGGLGAVLDARDNNRTGNAGPPDLTEPGSVPGGGRGTHEWAGDYDMSGRGDFGGMADYGPSAQEAAESGGYGGSGMYAAGGYFRGASGGQADKVPALLSHGEYVFDAPTVAALGGGNNEAGAKQLDRLREVIRRISHGTTKQPEPVNLGEALAASRRG